MYRRPLRFRTRGSARGSARRTSERPPLLVGTSGFTCSRADYLSAFEFLEVRQSFIEPPADETAERWRRAVPPSFEYALSAWQVITHPADTPGYRKLGRDALGGSQRRGNCGHFQRTDEVYEAWDEVAAAAEALRALAVVFETPATFTPTDEHFRDMEEFFAPLTADEGGDTEGPMMVWEPRGDEWTDERFAEWCEALSLVPAWDPFKRSRDVLEAVGNRPAEAPERPMTPAERLAALREPPPVAPRYLRVRGPGGYRHEFSHEELDALWLACTGAPTLCVFRNISAFEDGQAFREMVERRA